MCYKLAGHPIRDPDINKIQQSNKSISISVELYSQKQHLTSITNKKQSLVCIIEGSVKYNTRDCVSTTQGRGRYSYQMMWTHMPAAAGQTSMDR